MNGLLANGVNTPYAIKNNNPALNAKDIPDLRDVCDMGGMFADNANFNNPEIVRWDVSHVENMTSLFHGCTSFNQDISRWDVSRVVKMGGMFENASSFNQDIGKWDVSNVKHMIGMFENASSFNQDITAWDVSNLETVDDMFKLYARNVMAFVGRYCKRMNTLRRDNGH